jgi:pyruvate kinase
LVKTVRKVAADFGIEVAIICDLHGPKVRCKTFPGGFMTLKRGDLVTVIYSSNPRTLGLIRTKFQQMIPNWKDEAVLMDKKGINLPGPDLGPLPGLREKDIGDGKSADEKIEND